MRQAWLRSATALAAACHPEPTLAVTTLATVLAVGAGRGAGAVWVAAAVFCGQLSVGWANDYIDRDRDRLAGRTSKPVAAGRVSPDVVRRAAVVALVLALLMAHLYNLGLKSTPFSVVAYAVAFAQLPAFVTLGLSPPHWPPAWAVVAAGLIGAAGHFTQTLPDLESDRATGMRGLPHHLGAGWSLLAVGVLLAGGAIAAALGPIGHPPPLALGALGLSLALVLAVLVAGALRRYGAAFHLTIAAAAAALATFLVTGRPL
ncbi:MAG TPA: UbiA family prenyltransferase [Myxococcaceae bacterium]|nr:UbiA family prenyltransferase [Myxococcaceae bacterium]